MLFLTYILHYIIVKWKCVWAAEHKVLTWKGAAISSIISNAIRSFFVTPTFPSMRRQMLLNLGKIRTKQLKWILSDKCTKHVHPFSFLSFSLLIHFPWSRLIWGSHQVLRETWAVLAWISSDFFESLLLPCWEEKTTRSNRMNFRLGKYVKVGGLAVNCWR